MKPNWKIDPHPALAPVSLWLGIQILVLLISAMQFTFRANAAPSPERMALRQMLIVQTLASALLFPYLLRDWPTAIIVMASAQPMLALSAYLSAEQDYRKVVAGCLGVVLWLAGLTIWRRVLQSRQSQLIGTAAAAAMAAGGPALWYVYTEYQAITAGAPPEAVRWSIDALRGPIMALIGLSEYNSFTWPAWIFLGGHVALALGAIAVRGTMKHRWREQVNEE